MVKSQLLLQHPIVCVTSGKKCNLFNRKLHAYKVSVCVCGVENMCKSREPFHVHVVRIKMLAEPCQQQGFKTLQN